MAIEDDTLDQQADEPGVALQVGVEEIPSTAPYAPVKERRVLTQTYDYAVRQLMDMVVEGDLILDPDYQRLYRWPDDKAARFIESIILNIPVPVFYFAEESDGRLSVIDGQQRLTSLFRYMKPAELSGIFPARGMDELVIPAGLKLRPDLFERPYTSLSRDDRSALAKRPIRCIVVLNESDPALKFEVFERLNTGSAKLTDQETRNCLYRGNFNELIKDLAQNQKFQEMASLPSESRKSMKDVELILRFFAYRELSEDTLYTDNLNEYLNNFMEENREIGATRISFMRNLFEKTVDALYKYLGPGVAFRKPIDLENPQAKGFAPNLINGAIFESQMVAFSNVIEATGSVPSDVLERIYASFQVKDYNKSISQGTSQKARALRRNTTLTNLLSR